MALKNAYSARYMKGDFGRFLLIANIPYLLSSESHDHPATIPMEFQRSFDPISPSFGPIPLITKYPLAASLASSLGPLVATRNFIELFPMEATSKYLVIISVNPPNLDFCDIHKAKSDQYIDCFG